MDYCVVTFTSTSGAMYAQQVLKGKIPFSIMPVLREISKGCGISVRFAPGELPAARAALTDSDLREGEYAFNGGTASGAALRAAPI